MTDNTGGQILERNNLRNEDNSNDSISRFVSEINMSPMKVELEPPQKRSESRDAVDAKATEQTERQMEYFFKMPGNNSPYIYVTREKELTYQSFKMYVGKPGDMQERGIELVQRYRDGGTTIITGNDGSKLFVPTPFDKTKSPTFNGMKLEKADPNQFNISEDEHGLELKRK